MVSTAPASRPQRSDYRSVLGAMAGPQELGQDPGKPSLAHHPPLVSGQPPRQAVAVGRILPLVERQPAEGCFALLAPRHPRQEPNPPDQPLERRQAVPPKDVGKLVPIPEPDSPRKLLSVQHTVSGFIHRVNRPAAQRRQRAEVDPQGKQDQVGAALAPWRCHWGALSGMPDGYGG